MQFTTLAITLSLAVTASAETLRGATNSATLDQLASPDLHCNKKSYTATTCSDAVSSDGSKCVWCQTSKEQGACLSRSDADEVLNFFHLPCPAYSEEESGDDIDEEEAEDVEVSL